jgi:transposase
MANRLKMAEIHAILTLRTRGWSYRRIARELGVHRETVARYVALARAPAKPAIAPIGTEPAEPANALIGAEASDGIGHWSQVAERLPPPGRAGPVSGCEAYRAVVESKLAAGLTAVRIHQDLAAEHGATLSYHAVRRFVRKLHSATPLPFRRIEVTPGEEAQVDFGRGAAVSLPDGKVRRPHVFRIVLSHSRKGYSEVVPRQTTEYFLRCLENAFWHFGGVPRTVVIDNLKAAVTQADWFDPELNPKLQAFAQHYGTVILPTKPHTPRHKGKIERGVGYVQDNALKGRTFESLAAQNCFLAEWETTVADRRIHGTTRQPVGAVFEATERSALLPLPPAQFPSFQEGERIVNRDGHVEVAKAYYSVSPEHVGRSVWVRWDGHVVRIFDRRLQQIAIHAQHQAGQFATDPRHIAPAKRAGVERGAGWWLRKAHAIGGETGRWAEAVLRERGIHALRVIMGLVSLTRSHTDAAVEQACQAARNHGACRLRDVRNLLKRQAPPQQQFEFIQEHPLIRSLADYQALVHTAFEEVHA